MFRKNGMEKCILCEQPLMVHSRSVNIIVCLHTRYAISVTYTSLRFDQSPFIFHNPDGLKSMPAVLENSKGLKSFQEHTA